MKNDKGEGMPVFLILGCELAVLSFLIGAYLDSVGFGLCILGAVGLPLYFLFQEIYTFLPLVWGITLLGTITTLCWSSYIDLWLGTNFMAIFLALSMGSFLFVLNNHFLKKYMGLQ
jgi:hypothetical protein